MSAYAAYAMTGAVVYSQFARQVICAPFHLAACCKMKAL